MRENDIIGKLNNIIKIQGNCITDEYMRGMMNGLILARSIITGDEPEYINPDGKMDIKAN